jgi:hypothetical protein
MDGAQLAKLAVVARWWQVVRGGLDPSQRGFDTLDGAKGPFIVHETGNSMPAAGGKRFAGCRG